MIDIDLKFHLAMFGSYDDIKPKPDTLKYLIDSFENKELIPTTVQEFELANPSIPTNRLSLKSADGVWSVDFGPNRIDITKNNVDVGIVNMGDFKMFLEDSKNIVAVIEKKFPKKHNRLAILTSYLMNEMTKDEISKIFHKNFKTIDIFHNSEPVEWNNRVVARIQQKILEKEETLNIIAELNRTKGNLKINSNIESIDRVELRLDINTYQGTTDYRFEFKDLIAFIDEAIKIENKLKTDYINFLS